MPRHAGELFMEIGDPVYVEAEEDDLWCKGQLFTEPTKNSITLHAMSFHN